MNKEVPATVNTKPDKHPVSPIENVKWGPVSAVVISFLAYFVAQIILFIPLAIMAYFGLSSQDIESTLDNTAWLQLLFTGISSATLIAVLWIFLRHKKCNLKELGFKSIKSIDIAWLIKGLLIYYTALFAVLFIAVNIPGFNAEQSQVIGYGVANGWQLVLAFIGLVILPPLAEEMLFRGFLYRGLAKRWPKLVAAILASGLFAVVHFQWNVGVDVFVLSMVMIMLYEKTKNLWICVALHAVKNLIAFLMLFVFTGR